MNRACTTAILFLSTVLCAIFCASRAQAADIDTHGFFTMGYSVSNSDEEYLQVVNSQGTFAALSTAGVQLSSNINDRLNAKLQLVTRTRPSQTFDVDLDLAQVGYLASSNHQILMGKLRLPIYMISDYQMVGSLYPWNVPPPEVYDLLPPGSVGSNNTFTGINLVSHWMRFDSWSLDSEAYVGGSSERIESPQEILTTKSRRLFGGNLTAGNENIRLRISYLNTLHNASSVSLGSPAPGGPTDTSLGVIQFLTAGVKWEPGQWLVMSEAARITTESARFRKVTNLYGTIGHHFFDRTLLVHTTLSGILSSSESSSNLGQMSYSFGTNYTVSDALTFKLEAARVTPQAGPQPQSPPGSPPTPARPNNAMTILHASVNVVF